MMQLTNHQDGFAPLDERVAPQKQDSSLTVAKGMKEAVCAAAWNSNLKTIEKLVELERSNVMNVGHSDLLSSVGFGPLHFAASLGKVEILQHLLDNKLGNKDSRDKDGNTPLMWVVRSDASEELMEALVDHGANVNIQNYAGETALFIAASRGLYDKVEFLLENAAKIQICNLDGASPLHAAVAGSHEDVVSLLIQYGAFLNAGDDEDDTPLHWAVREGNPNIIRLLIEAGCDQNCLNGDGESPLALAKSLEENDIIECLSGSTYALTSPIRKANMVKMEVEMKHLIVNNNGFADNGRVANAVAFGSTPPALSFVF